MAHLAQLAHQVLISQTAVSLETLVEHGPQQTGQLKVQLL